MNRGFIQAVATIVEETRGVRTGTQQGQGFAGILSR